MQILFHLMANTGCLPDKVVLDSQWSSIPMQPAPEFRKCLLDITKKWLEEE